MRRQVLILAVLIFMQGAAFSFWPFNKKYDKQEQEKKQMVQTVDEWLESATSLKMDMRKREEDIQQKDDRMIPPAEKPLYIVPYNVKAGSRELNLAQITKTENVRSDFVADPKFDNAVYSEVYFYPQTNQIASTLYMLELDGHLSKKERLADVSIFEHTRYPLISTALPYLRENFFSTLTLVDYSSDGKKLLVKEKRGSRKYGLYETYVWLYFFTDEPRENSRCYRNNIDFSTELSTYDALNESPNQGLNEEIISQNSAAGQGQTGLKLSPLTSTALNNGSLAAKSDNNTPNGANQTNGTEYGGSFDLNKNLKAPLNLNNISNVPNENIPVPNFTYKDISGFIQASWREQLKEPSATSRWYNAAPADFRVDDNYSTNKKNPGFGVRLNLLNEMIKAYWFDRQYLILNHIRWDLNPLGFNKNNENEIIVAAWAYGLNGEEISLGRWAVNINDGLPRLVQEDEKIQIQANGFIVEAKLNP